MFEKKELTHEERCAEHRKMHKELMERVKKVEEEKVKVVKDGH